MEEEIIDYINKAIKYDNQAFDNLIKYYENDFYRIAYINLKNHEDVLDALQNTYVQIFKSLKKLKDKDKYKSWAIKILINECNKIHKHRKLEFENIENLSDKDLNNIYYSDKTNNIADQISIKMNLNALSKDDRTMIVLKYTKGIKIKEIAEIMNMPENTIKTRLKRAKEKLKERLNWLSKLRSEN